MHTNAARLVEQWRRGMGWGDMPPHTTLFNTSWHGVGWMATRLKILRTEDRLGRCELRDLVAVALLHVADARLDGLAHEMRSRLDAHVLDIAGQTMRATSPWGARALLGGQPKCVADVDLDHAARVPAGMSRRRCPLLVGQGDV